MYPSFPMAPYNVLDFIILYSVTLRNIILKKGLPVRSLDEPGLIGDDTTVKSLIVVSSILQMGYNLG